MVRRPRPPHLASQMTYRKLVTEFRAEGNQSIAAHSSRFFKTGQGQYGEGDLFLGIRVPVIRKHAKKYKTVSLDVVKKLLTSRFHEERLLAAILLVEKFETAPRSDRESIFRLYLDNTAFINNWDIVDSSAPQIVGAFLKDKNRKVLRELASSASLWERRISIIATLTFIRERDFGTTLQISEMLISDTEDLIHKAVGWMLREVGNRDLAAEQDFLAKHYTAMPRTMLRYAIERFPENLRQRYLRGEL